MSIYTSPPVSTDTFAVGANPLTKTLPWSAVQVIVDNPTTQWLYLPAARRFIDPGRMGAVIPFPGNTEVSAQWQAPVGFVNPPPIAGQAATLVWLSPGIEAAPSAGVAASVNTFSNALFIDRIDTAAGSGNRTYTLPNGAKAIMVTVDAANGTRTVGPTNLNLFGLPSQLTMFSVPGSILNFAAQQVGRVDPADTQFQVVWTMAGANPLNKFLDVVVVSTDLVQPIPFAFDSNVSLFVSMAAANPAVWQVPNLAPIPISFALGAGLSTTLLPAVVGKIVYLFACAITYDALPGAGALELQDTAGTNLHFFEGTTLVPSPLYAYGVALPLGRGVQMTNPYAATVTARGSLVASQL